MGSLPYYPFLYPTQTLLLIKDHTAKPNCWNLFSGWNSASGICILLLYTFWSSTEWEKRIKDSKAEFWTISPPTSIGIKNIAWGVNDLEESWQQDCLKTCTERIAWQPTLIFTTQQIQGPTLTPSCRPEGPTHLTQTCPRSLSALIEML